jgi:Zn-dependent protease with chaperone function
MTSQDFVPMTKVSSSFFTLFAWLLCIWFSASLSAQNFAVYGYQPIPIDAMSVRKQEVKLVQKRYDAFKQTLKASYPDKLGATMADDLRKVKDYLTDDIVKGQFILDHEVLRYTRQVFAKLCAGYGIDPSLYHVMVRRSPELNAACYPDGTFVVNMGLFYYLHNEHEFAAILAHELAHKLLKHWEQRSEMRYLQEKDPNYRAEVKNIKSQTEGRYDMAFELLKGQLYADRQFRRNHEFEADSLGFLIVRQSVYKPEAVGNGLALMLSVDSFEFTGIAESTYREVFNTPDLAFRDEWLAIEDLSAYDYSRYKESLDKDSMSTHPETAERLARVAERFGLQEGEHSLDAEGSFVQYKEIAVKEIVPFLYFHGDYGAALHAALMLYEHGESKDYCNAWIGRCLSSLADARKLLTFNKYIRQVNPREQSSAQQQFLSFMWNLKTSELQQLAEYYQATYPVGE